MSLRCEQATVHATNLPIPRMEMRRSCIGFLLSIFRSFYHSSRHLLALPDFYVVFHSIGLCVTATFAISLYVSFLQILWTLVRYHNFRVILFHNLLVFRF